MRSRADTDECRKSAAPDLSEVTSTCRVGSLAASVATGRATRVYEPCEGRSREQRNLRVQPQPVNAHSEEEWNELSAKLSEAESEIKRLIAEKETEREAEKSKIYDEMSAQVGNIIISANANADRIVSEVRNSSAEKIVMYL